MAVITCLIFCVSAEHKKNTMYHLIRHAFTYSFPIHFAPGDFVGNAFGFAPERVHHDRHEVGDAVSQELGTDLLGDSLEPTQLLGSGRIGRCIRYVICMCINIHIYIHICMCVYINMGVSKNRGTPKPPKTRGFDTKIIQ